MNKIVLVDDEKLALKSLAKTVKWENYGFELSGVFTSGLDCLDYIKENDVDVVISDISMPQMDGIELTKKINELRPDTKIVLVSAYKNFDYALEAVKLKVFDYILKPFDLKTIESLLLKIKEHIVKSNVNNNSFILNSDENIKIQKLICDFIEQKNRRFLENEVSVANVDIRNVPVIIMNIAILEIEEYLDKVWKYGITGLYNAINNIIYKEENVVFPLKYSFDNISFVLFAKDDCLENLLINFDKLKNNVVSECFEFLNLSVNVDIIQSGKNLEDIVNIQIYNTISLQSKMLITSVEEKNKNGISENISGFFNLFSKDEKIILTYCTDILNKLINLYGIDYIRTCDENYTDIFHIQDIANLKKRIEEICINVISKSEYEDLYDAITVAKKYVAQHLETGTSLAEVAEYVSFSPSYFGRVFKEKTGEKFLDYVNKVRIEAAHNYLATTGMKVNEIYEKVGYKSRNYFYNMFKSVSGCTPQEYREKIRNNK